VNYEKYHGVQLTEKGKKTAIALIRRHRLWEVFLVEKLRFNWDQVHEVAEELEHVSSPLLISRLDVFLNSPRYDPHGDPIPDEKGNIAYHEETTLNQLQQGDNAEIVNVGDQSVSFLQYLDKNKIYINSKLEVTNIDEYDHSMTIRINKTTTLFISEKVGKNLIVKKDK
jgi:DtxR family transcriptional regulator, Mn-dependent transcriptional regulator